MKELERHNYLAPLEKDSSNMEDFNRRQVGFCTQWCLDNLCTSPQLNWLSSNSHVYQALFVCMVYLYVCIVSMYVWCVYMVCLYGMYVWYVVYVCIVCLAPSALSYGCVCTSELRKEVYSKSSCIVLQRCLKISVPLASLMIIK